MQFVSAQEKQALELKREELYKAQIDVQDRIRKAASLGDLSENAEYHFAKEENRSIQRQLAELLGDRPQFTIKGCRRRLTCLEVIPVEGCCDGEPEGEHRVSSRYRTVGLDVGGYVNIGHW